MDKVELLFFDTFANNNSQVYSITFRTSLMIL